MRFKSLFFLIVILSLIFACEEPVTDNSSDNDDDDKVETAEVTFTLTLEIPDDTNHPLTTDDIDYVKIMSGKGTYNIENPVADFEKNYLESSSNYTVESQTDVRNAVLSVKVSGLAKEERWFYVEAWSNDTENTNKGKVVQHKDPAYVDLKTETNVEITMDAIYGDLGITLK